MKIRTISREALAAALAQPVVSALTALLVAATCVIVVLTAGRSAGTEGRVLASIDAVGTRSIVIRADALAGLDSGSVARVSTLDGVTWIGAFGPAVDARNIALGDAAVPVPVRDATTTDWSWLDADQSFNVDESVWASETALHELRVDSATGAIRLEDGIALGINREITVPPTLEFLEPLVIAPHDSADVHAVTIMVIIVDRPSIVAAVADVVPSFLDLDDPQAATIATSESLASLREIVQSEIASAGRTSTLIYFGIAGTLTGITASALVLMRRKDYGRRRALGASQAWIISMLIIQTGFLAAVGSLFGLAVGLAALLMAGDPLPNWSFIAATACIACLSGVLGAIPPALIAATRDPLRELRVP